jgi:hypothetical protein
MLWRYRRCAKDFAEEAEPQAILTPIFKGNARYWAFAYPVIVLPSPLAAVWVFACQLLNRLDKATGLFMLTCWSGTNGN